MKDSDFWETLQLGNLPEKAVLREFQAKVLWRIYVFAIIYTLIVSFFSVAPRVVVSYPRIDFLFNPISILLGFIITFEILRLSFQSHFLQQATTHKVITCPGQFTYEGKECLVFLTNRAETTVFRNISLFAFREVTPPIMFRLLGIPAFEIFATHPIFQGMYILPAGDSMVFRKEDIIRGIKGVRHDLSLRYPNFKEDLQVCIFAHNEDFDLSNPQTHGRSLIAGALLGRLSDLERYAKGEVKNFPVHLPIGGGVYMQLIMDRDKPKLRGRFPGKLIKESVAIPPLWNREIFNKLDSIDSKLSEIMADLEKREK